MEDRKELDVIAIPASIIPVQVPDEDRPHPRPVGIGVLESPHQVIGLLRFTDFHPFESIPERRHVVAKTICGMRIVPPPRISLRVAQITEFGQPDRAVA